MVTVANCEWHNDKKPTTTEVFRRAGPERDRKRERGDYRVCVCCAEHENKFIKAFIKFDTCLSYIMLHTF